jgi:2,5-diamino-6-(ribosylamino)-4(3H)-pyrimidinone 5'-phosphate reductase
MNPHARVLNPSSRNASRLTPHAPRPFVFINMAMTADGKIATANRAVSSFGSRRDVEHIYELRATADAVMAGARTIDVNPVKLGPGGARFRKLRLEYGLSEYGLRVIVSGSGTIDPRATIFRHRFSPIVVLTTQRAGKATLEQLRGLADDVVICGKTQIDFVRALAHLWRKWRVKRLLCEGGGELNAALFRARLVDELHLTICPKIFGGRLAPTIAEGEHVRHLFDAARLELKSLQGIGDELFCVYRAAKTRAR